MRHLVKPVLAISALGFALSLIAHITGLLGIDLKLGTAVFALHIGIFVVWFPAVLLAMRMGRGKNTSAWGFRTTSWKQILSGCPSWMQYFLYALFAYVLLNFFLFMGQTASGGPDDSPSSPQVIRGFSGHWLVFYYAAFAIAYSALMKPELLSEANCKMGHKALPTDKFCSECGNPVIVKMVT